MAHHDSVAVVPLTPIRRVFVIPTASGLEAAVARAERLASDRGAEVVVLVPHVVPYGTGLSSCGCDLKRLADSYRPAVASCRRVRITVCACREPAHLFSLLLVEGARVVVAGRRGRWWRSPEERLVQALVREGHRVDFIELPAAPPVKAGASHGRRSRGRLRLVPPIQSACSRLTSGPTGAAEDPWRRPADGPAG